MSTATPKRATIDDLYRVEGKAELIGGRVVKLMASGYLPSLIALEIAVSLRDYSRRVGRGFALADGMGFTVPELASGRESFCPDASYYDGSPPVRRMRFLEAPPTLAVEVRSEGDYGPTAERQMAEKRADYFAAGTLVVWDVDPETETVCVYRAGDALAAAATYSRGQAAEAEPAVPGWRPEVDAIFGPSE
jgi:Uma2 family endonuclease